MTDLATLLEATTPTATAPLDLERARRDGRRRRSIRRAAGAAGAAGVVVAAVTFGTVGVWPSSPGVGIEAVGSAESHEQVRAAVDRLTDLARQRPVDAPLEGQGLAIQAVEVQLHESGAPADSWLTVSESKSSLPVNGTGKTSTVSLAERVAVGASADDLRHLVDARLGRSDQPVEQPAELPDIDARLSAAERLVRDNTESARMDQAEASHVIETLRETLAFAHGTQERIRALQLIAAVPKQFVRFQTDVADLHGRAGVGFSMTDPSDDSTSTFIFDPETGRYLGDMVERPWGDATAITHMSAIDTAIARITEPGG